MIHYVIYRGNRDQNHRCLTNLVCSRVEPEAVRSRGSTGCADSDMGLHRQSEEEKGGTGDGV